MATLVKVEWIEGRPELAAQVPTSEKASDVRSRSMLCSTSGPEPAGGDAERSQAPVILRQGTTNELAHWRAKIPVRSPEPAELSTRGHGATGIEDLGPPRAGPQQAESPVSIREPANGGQEGPSLADAATQELLPPLIGPNRSSQKLEVGCTLPQAPLEVTRAERLGGRARRDDLRFTHVDCEPDAAEAFDESGKEAADGWGGTST